MSERRRALPSWMCKKGDGEKEKQPLKTSRKKKVARAVVYCMNEKELVETAAAYLGDQRETLLFDQQARSKTKDAARKRVSSGERTGKRAATEDGEAAREHARVSETDLDVAETETLPYAGSDRGGEDSARRRTAKTEGRRLTENQSGDDGVRLVREIFFNR
ncbi:uncharacterized protein si:ch211-127m7.2 [Syngnathoides biaculeatus]|uniref:uncharacterized protein si:ch211-127m7.2 n=1 Tax=Syngnathoides biaculeatus TaxID=300417 RepID=UPI002ADDD5D5|nr:uncharacterized protein si:ch211-127m7.2 [Syngnathoides biaculeatus]